MPLIESSILALVLAVSLMILLFNRWMIDAVIEALHNFRGGGPTPMHPSPVNDGALLRKRFRKPRS